MRFINFLLIIILFSCSISRQQWIVDVGEDILDVVVVEDIEVDEGIDLGKDEGPDIPDLPDSECNEVGEKKCSEDNQILVCEIASDNSRYWDEDKRCADYEVCEHGECLCNASQCTLDKYRCNDGDLEVCEALKADCNEWSSHTECGALYPGFSCTLASYCTSAQLTLNYQTTGNQTSYDAEEYAGGFSSIKRLPNNTFVIVWQSEDYGTAIKYLQTEGVIITTTIAYVGNKSIKMGIFNSAGGRVVSGDILVSAHTEVSNVTPSFEITELGEIIVVWKGYWAGFDSFVVGRRFSSIGEPGPEFLIGEQHSQETKFPFIRKRTDGSFVVSWGFRQLSNYYIALRRLDSQGNPFGTETILVAYATDFSPRNQVGALPDGKFLVTWKDRNEVKETPQKIYFQLFQSDMSPLNVYTIETQNDLWRWTGYGGPYFVRLSANRFFIGWREENSGDYNIYLNLYQFDNATNAATLLTPRIKINQSELEWDYSLGSFPLNDHRTALLWSENDYIYAKFFNSQGELVSSKLTLISNNNSPLGPTGIEIADNFYFISWTAWVEIKNYEILGRLLYMAK